MPEQNQVGVISKEEVRQAFRYLLGMLQGRLRIANKRLLVPEEKQVGSISRQDVRHAFRYILGREMEEEEVLDFHQKGHDTIDSLRRAFLLSPEFRAYYKILSTGYSDLTIPPFLIEPCVDRTVPYRFAPPTLETPASQLCTADQHEEVAYSRWCGTLRTTPTMHRKQWEFVFALQALEKFGALKAGHRGLGFGTGNEPLPALFASLGISVVATDAPSDLPGTATWSQSSQHADSVAALWRPDFVEKTSFEALVSFEPVDMNEIPDRLVDFDFVWSCCAYEHLGSIEKGLHFVERSLDCLKPGGIAVHTTEFNLSSNDRTLDLPMLCLFRKQDFERLASRLTAAGHEVAPLNFYPGTQPLDIHIDLPPYSMPHLKLLVAEYVTTSFGLIVRKRA